jgi:glycosyltransferase involved in cell wall biosynthesis
MKICYFGVGSDTLRNGYHQKIFRTIDIWREMGCETLWVLGSRAGAPAATDFAKGIKPSGEARLWTWPSGMSRYFPEKEACSSVLKWRPDVIYIRSAYFTPAINGLLEAVPACIEINTNEDAERKQFGRLHYLYFRISSRYVLKRVRGIICVTREIARLARYSRTQKPIKVIANGIPLENCAPRPISPEKNPILVMMATGQYRWHGLDKLAILARKFPTWTIHILGDAPVDSDLAGCGNVKVHGLLKRGEFEPILAQAHVGLGPLALHRKEMEEACPLKVREYLSYGLPVIGGYVDTDFPQGAEFFLQIANREDNVATSLDAIEKFVAYWMQRRVAPSEIAHLDFRSKERERLAFLEQIYNGKKVGSAVACA